MHDSKDLILKANVEVCFSPYGKEDWKGFGTGVRPNHSIPGRHYFFFGQLDFKDRDWLKPGESCEAEATFCVPQADLALFVPGMMWHITITGKIVGYGRLLSVVSTKGIVDR
ncbi:MAG: hypothetical protein FJ190_10295 [Gammaproteobacteria bacterium]|nr:hypothetical protein [Gammaproteobacteria bacterium]